MTHKEALEKIANCKDEIKDENLSEYFVGIAEEALKELTEVTDSRMFSEEEVNEILDKHCIANKWWMTSNERHTVINAIKEIQSLSPKSEPRMFSEGDKTFQECKDSIARIEMSAVNFNYNQNMGWWEWVRYCYPSEEQQKEAYNKAVKMFQSLSPKEGKEENGLIKQQSEKWKKLNADFDSAIGRASREGYFEKFSLLPESSNPIATDHTTIEPNQTEAKKEEEVIGNELKSEYAYLSTPSNHIKLSNEDWKEYDLGAELEKTHSLARKQVIEEIEGFVEKESISATDEGGVFYENVIDSDYLLTKLSQLKITK